MQARSHILRANFNRAAVQYDQFSDFQKYAAQQLLAIIPKPLIAERVLDLGCGTGYLSQHLPTSAPELIGIDIAENMLQRTPLSRVCGNAESLPFANNSVDAIVSNLMLQWSTQPETVLQECWRVLKPQGQLFFTTLGPNSLHELRRFWRKIDGKPHTLNFLDCAELAKHVNHVGLTVVQQRQTCITWQYETILHFMKSLKAIGAQHISLRRPAGLVFAPQLKAQLKKLRAQPKQPSFENTYELILCHCRKN